MNAPSTFQRLIDRVLHGLTWRQCLVYIDDVLVFSPTFEEHLKHIDEVLARFEFAGLKLKPTKCLFANSEVDYLGFKITRHGITATAEKLKAITSLLPPTHNKQLYSFLCSINYYRSLIPNFGELTHALYSMVRTGKKSCDWSPATLKCFDALKRSLVIAPVLAFPDFSKQFVVHSDASDFAIGSVLLQTHDSLLKPVAFASRRLIAAEVNYTVSERELLSITYAYDQFYAYLYGRHIIFYTDHNSLVTMRTLRNVNVERKRLDRLFHRLVDVDYELRYIPGSENYLADFLSRAFVKEKVVAEANHIHFKSAINWLVEQSKNSETASIAQLLTHEAADREWLALPNGRRWLSERSNLHLSSNGTLLHGKNRIVCPTHMVEQVLALFHDSPFAGHRAFETTLDALKHRYFWFSMSSIVKQYCQSCHKCQAFNFSCLHPRAPLQPIIATRPWQLVGTDFMGPFPTSDRGNVYIILAIDHFTKFAEGAATASFDAKTTAHFLFDTIVCRHGMFEKLLSDQGVNFESNLLKHLCILLGTEKLHTSTYHAAGNGITERLNKTIKPALAKFVNATHTDWDSFLPMALSAYNNSVHSTTKMTPFEALYHRPSVQVSDVLLANQLPFGTVPHTVSDFILQVRRSAEHISNVLLDNTQRAQHKQKEQYDRFTRDNVQFKVGDSVKITNFRQRPGTAKGLEPKFIGPYSIVKRTSNLNYDLQSDSLPREHVHFNRIEKYHQRRAVIAPNPTAAPPPTPPCQVAHVLQAPITTYDPPIVIRRSPRFASPAPTMVVVPVDDAVDDDLYIGDLFVDVADSDDNDIDTSASRSDSVATPSDTALIKNGKPAVRCQLCNLLFEAVHGIKIHTSSCMKKAARLSRSSPSKLFPTTASSTSL